jgi:hypothetical protein
VVIELSSFEEGLIILNPPESEISEEQTGQPDSKKEKKKNLFSLFP